MLPPQSPNSVYAGSYTIVMIYTYRREFGEPHFRRFIVLTHISNRPSFASEVGKLLIAFDALSAYSCANALVCSSPLLHDTSSRAYELVSKYRKHYRSCMCLAYSLDVAILGKFPPDQRTKLLIVLPCE